MEFPEGRGVLLFSGILLLVLHHDLLFMVESYNNYKTKNVQTDLPSCNFPALYNFGDSNSDTGAMAAAFFQMAPPSGETYFGRPVGRGSDGRLIIDFLAEKLGLPFLSAYLDSIGTSYRHGANFATGSGTIRRQNESWFLYGVSPFPLDIQVQHYTQFKERTTFFYNQGKIPSCERSRLPRPKDFRKAIYTFDMGQNDIADGLRMMSSVKEVHVALPDIVNIFAEQIRDLYKKGARVFWIHNTGPLGCLPVAVLTAKDPAEAGFFDEHGCIKFQNDLAMAFNKLLKNEVIRLRSHLPKASLIYVDMYAAKYELIINAQKEGFESSFTICCGIHDKINSVWCGKKGYINGKEVIGSACAKPSTVVSWDGVHYTDAANYWIATRIINGSFSDPPLPITRACHAHYFKI